jgi:alkanesulfonate monooxygenase SsuD/methylene tetrahydromethanopterin reductase-like flavin-dependent oxidoreductase (luciferase family)
MKFGLFGGARSAGEGSVGDSLGYRKYIDYVLAAEDLGYHSVFVVEHHFTGVGQLSASLNFLSYLAGRTERIRLGTAVVVLPWHNPALLAEQVATLDLLSNGRFDFGIGKGYRHNEFAGFRIPIEEAEPRFEESVEVMTRAFVSRERFSHRGRFWQFDDIVVEPPPAQKPHPPFWVAAASDASIRRAARRGFNLILDQYASPEQHGRRIALFRAERLAAGLPFDPMQVAVARQLHVANDKAEAAQALKRAAAATQRTVDVSRLPGGKAGSHVLSYADKPGATEAHTLYDTPDGISEKLGALRQAGVGYILLTTLGGPAQLRRFAGEIMPGFLLDPEPRSGVSASESTLV